MVNRRLLRIKVLQILYGFYCGDAGSLPASEKALLASVVGYFDLEHVLWNLPSDLAYRDERQREDRQAREQRYRRTPARETSVRTLQDSRVVKSLRANDHLLSHRSRSTIAFRDPQDLYDQLLSDLRRQPFYQIYLAAEHVTWDEDRAFWVACYEHLGELELLRDVLQEADANLAVDIDTAIQSVCHSLLRHSEPQLAERLLVPEHLEAKDRDFIIRLLGMSVLQRERLLEHVARFTHKWEMDRLAVMDLLILQMATAEALNFDEIPRRVTINEYIELAHLFCTPSSPSFINGILDTLTQTLMAEGVMVKRGLGLQGD